MRPSLTVQTIAGALAVLSTGPLGCAAAPSPAASPVKAIEVAPAGGATAAPQATCAADKRALDHGKPPAQGSCGAGAKHEPGQATCGAASADTKAPAPAEAAPTTPPAVPLASPLPVTAATASPNPTKAPAATPKKRAATAGQATCGAGTCAADPKKK